MSSAQFSTFKRSAVKAALASVLVLGAGFSGTAFAIPATSTATSTVMAPIGITAPVVLSFGNFAPGAGGSVTISNSGTRSALGVILSSTSGTQSAARFDVVGDANTSYSISHSGVTALTGISGAALTLPSTMALAKTSDLTGANVTTGNVATGTLSGAGTQSIYVGGTLTVSSTQPAGVYTGAVTVTVEYN